MQRINITDYERITDEPRGFIDKFWIKDKNLHLVKLNSLIYPDQDLMELLASRIHKINNVETVNIDLISHNTHGYGCMVESFLKEDEVLLEVDSNIKVTQSDSVKNNISRALWHVFSIFNNLNTDENELEKVKTDYVRMIFSDCLVENEDRMLRNVGVILNERTGKYKLSPVFDNGLAYSCFPSLRGPIACVANITFDRDDVLHFMFEHFKDSVYDIAESFVNNHELIVNEVHNIKDALDPEKYKYILNRLEKTNELVSKHVDIKKKSI